MAVDHATYTIDARTAAFAVPTPGTIELVDGPTLRREAPPIYERYRARQPGAIGRDDHWWDANLGIMPIPGREEPPGFHVLGRDEGGQAAGFLRYHVDGTWDGRIPSATLFVDDLVGATPAAEARLWRHCVETDWVRTVKAENRRTADALPWLLTDARAARPAGPLPNRPAFASTPRCSPPRTSVAPPCISSPRRGWSRS